MKDILDMVAAPHFTIQVKTPNKENPTQAFFVGPDNIRIELLADKNLATVSESHQIDLGNPYRTDRADGGGAFSAKPEAGAAVTHCP